MDMGKALFTVGSDFGKAGFVLDSRREAEL
jgi:hypothetical protein